MFRKIAVRAGALALVPAAFAGVSIGAQSAHAAVPVTATTHLTQRPDSGYGGNWALDSLTRTVTVAAGTATTPSLCGAAATTCFAYTATIDDTGTAFATTGATSPGAQAVPVKGTPKAAVTGSATVMFDASSGTPDATLVPASLAGAGNAQQSTQNWVEQLFPAGTTFGAGPSLPVWTWTYTDAKDCQKWTDALNGTKATSGDITGADSCNTTVAPVGNQSVTIGQPASIPVFGSTTSSDKALTYAATGLPDGLAIDASTGVVSGTPKAGAASGTVNITVTDFGGVAAGTSFGVTVKPALTTPAPPVVLSAGHVVAGTLLPSRAEVAWTAKPAAAEYKVVINGPGFANRANTIKASAAFYTGLHGGHTYVVTVTPENPDGSTSGASGHVTFVTPTS